MGETMSEELSRRELLVAVWRKVRTPFRVLTRVVALGLCAWILMLFVELVRGVTLNGWGLMGGILLGICLLAFVRWLAGRIYDRFSVRGKALCDAISEVTDTVAIICIGILAWDMIRTDGVASAIVPITALVMITKQKGQEVYRQKSGEQASCRHSDG